MPKKIIIKAVCNKCGKVAPIDYEKSSKTFITYKTDEPCNCGGQYVTKLCEVKSE